jgi:PST family polysaccharide transporter
MSNSQTKSVIVPPLLSPSPPSKEKQLQRSLVRGIAWTGLVKWGSQVLSWASTIVVARLLIPSDYGLVALATAFLGLVALVNEFGLGSAIVMLPQLSTRQIRQLNSLAVLLGLAGFGFACLGAIPLSQFYGAPDLPLVIVVLAAGFIVGAFRSVPYAILEKGLNFKTLAFLEGGQSLLGAITTVLLAWNGAGYWALVLGNLFSNMVTTGVVVALYGQSFTRPVVHELGDVLRFSWHMLASRVSWYLGSTSDVFVAGRILGQAPLGAYTFGATLANVPMEKVTGLINRVTPAFYSAVQNDHATLRRYIVGLTEGLALITVPVALGMALVANEFVLLVLGEKWNAVGAPLQVLAVYGAFRSVTSLVAPLFFITGGSRIAMLNGFVGMILFPIGFLVGSQWGIVGIALAWLIVHPINLAPMYWHVLPSIGLSFWQYLRSLWPAVSGALVMIAAVTVLRSSIPEGSSLATRFAVLVLAGGAAYLLTLLALHRQRIRSFVTMMKGGLR